jgi:hypothetical protein
MMKRWPVCIFTFRSLSPIKFPYKAPFPCILSSGLAADGFVSEPSATKSCGNLEFFNIWLVLLYSCILVPSNVPAMASLQLSDAVGYQIRDQADHLTSLRMNRMWEFAAGFNGISDDDLQNLRNTLHIMADGYLQ